MTEIRADADADADPLASARPTLSPGSVVDDRYEILACLSESESARVYHARHVQIRHEVALEVLRADPERTSCEFEQRFARALQRAETIDHPNAVKIHDFGFCGEHRAPYVATEYVDGIDLDAALKQAPLEPARLLPLFLTCLDALAEAHDIGLVHTGLEPSKFLLSHVGTDRERLLVLDLGAASMSHAADSSGGNARLLSSRYAAPETVTDGEHDTVSDVYQLGLTVAACLMGRAVVAASDPAECLRAHCRGDLAVPRRLAESPLGDVLKQALAFVPAERFADARALREALERVDPGHVPPLSSEDLDDLVHLAPPREALPPPADVALQSLEVDEETGDAVALQVPAMPDDPSGVHALAAGGDRRGILASMDSIDQLEPGAAAAGHRRTTTIVAAVVVTALVTVLVLVLVEQFAAGGSVSDESDADGSEGSEEPVDTTGAGSPSP